MNKLRNITIILVAALLFIFIFSFITTYTSKSITQPLRSDINKLYRLDIKH